MTENDIEDWEEWDSKNMSFMTHMVAGSAAGLAEHVSIYPVDTIRTHLQCEKCGSSSPLNTLSCGKNLIRREGIFRLWRGVSAMFAGCIPAHAAYFSIYESMKIFLGADKEGHHPLGAALSGASAALSHDLLMTPFDTAKQRMQLGYYRGTFHCFRTILATEGVRAFYVSLPLTLTMNIPYGCVMVAVNESTKKVLQSSGNYNILLTSMVAGGIAGGVAAFLTNPLDVIKTKLQTRDLQPCNLENIKKMSSSNSNNAPACNISKLKDSVSVANRFPVIGATSVNATSREAVNFSSSLQVARQIYLQYGFSGFSRGVLPRVLVHSPSVAISWTAYEAVKSLLVKLEHK